MNRAAATRIVHGNSPRGAHQSAQRYFNRDILEIVLARPNDREKLALSPGAWFAADWMLKLFLKEGSR
jgi:type IV secretory pathway TrbF-like protein